MNPELRITAHVHSAFAIAQSTTWRGGDLVRGRMLRDFTYYSKPL